MRPCAPPRAGELGADPPLPGAARPPTETLAELNAFRGRAAAARAAHAAVKEQKTTVDFEHYRAVLKNKDIVAEGEKLFKSFKAVDYDVQAQLKAIAAFEAKAVSRSRAQTPPRGRRRREHRTRGRPGGHALRTVPGRSEALWRGCGGSGHRTGALQAVRRL